MTSDDGAFDLDESLREITSLLVRAVLQGRITPRRAGQILAAELSFAVDLQDSLRGTAGSAAAASPAPAQKETPKPGQPGDGRQSPPIKIKKDDMILYTNPRNIGFTGKTGRVAAVVRSNLHVDFGPAGMSWVARKWCTLVAAAGART
jgi:hypothetical protein